MRPSSTARRYAQAAFDVAREDGDVQQWMADLRSARDTFQDQALGLYFKDPNVPTEEKQEALRKVFGNVRPHVMNLLQILATKQRIHLLPAILEEFEELEREARGILEADVTVARPIDQRERGRIAERLGQVTGKQVEVHVQVDPAILGGVVVRIGDQLIDGSVAGRLQRLRQEMVV